MSLEEDPKETDRLIRQDRKLKKQPRKMARNALRKANHGHMEMASKVRRLPQGWGGEQYVENDTLERVNTKLKPEGLHVRTRRLVGPLLSDYHKFVLTPMPSEPRPLNEAGLKTL